MTFEEIVAKVILQTSRGDMGFTANGGDERIPNQVLASTQYLHMLDFFYKDIKTCQVVFDTTAYIQSLDIDALPRYRALSYFRKNDPTASLYQQNPTLMPPLFDSGSGILVSIEVKDNFLEVVTPTSILDEYQTEKLDVIYQVGKSLMMKCSTSLQYGLIGYYAYPNVNPTDPRTTYDSWIAEDLPWAVIHHATSAIFSSIGQQDQARKYDSPTVGLSTQMIEQLVKMNVTMEGR